MCKAHSDREFHSTAARCTFARISCAIGLRPAVGKRHSGRAHGFGIFVTACNMQAHPMVSRWPSPASSAQHPSLAPANHVDQKERAVYPSPGRVECNARLCFPPPRPKILKLDPVEVRMNVEMTF